MSEVALITGALGDIGLAVARAFRGLGYRLGLLDFDTDRASQAEAEFGPTALIVQADVRDSGQVREAVSRVEQAFGPIKCLVNCAGVMRWSPLIEMAEAEWDFVLDINLKGTFVVCQQVATRMTQTGQGGRIINLASGLAVRPQPELAHYAASKAGVIAFSKTLALELGPHRINVNCIAPGQVDTQLIVSKRSAADIADYAARTPLGQVVKPEDVAEVALFLAGPQSRLITGQTVFLNGGGLMP